MQIHPNERPRPPKAIQDADFVVATKRGNYLVRDHTKTVHRGWAVVPPYSPGPPDYWAESAAEAEAWCVLDALGNGSNP